jgi:hypothetical protein
MKKLFTLIAFLTMFMGAKAANWVEVYSIDYSTNTGFPFYVMGYVPEWVDGVMTDYGADFRYATQDVLDNGDSNGNGKLAEGESSVGSTMTQGQVEYQKVTGAGPYWHQYFIADGIPTANMSSYKVVAMVKASEAVNININMGWSWSEDPASATVSIGTDWTEVEWEYNAVNGTSCNLVAQPGTATATIEWKSLKVYEDQRQSRPTVWQQWLTKDGKSQVIETTFDKVAGYMGNAETPWEDATVRFDDQEKNYLICAWSKEKGNNMNENQGWDPFPANIEVDPTDPNNHVFVCHGQPATTEGDASAWDNQFWIESPKQWKAGEQVKIKFRYRASKTVTTQTQIHHQNPSDYMTWQGLGDVTFTEEWQDYEKVYSWPSDGARTDDTGWSVAFNLNANDKEAIDFYFDDLSWESMVLDEGLFVASANTKDGIEYDFDNAIEFVYDEGEQAYKAIVGESGWVNEVMISTIRGNDASFKGATLKPENASLVTSDPDNWPNYAPASNAKIKLNAAGKWQIMVDTSGGQMNFVMLEGEQPSEPVDIITNPIVITVNALERQPTAAEQPADEAAGIAEGTGQPWDNQFFIVANRVLDAGEETVVEFDYVATKEANASTQTHAQPGSYIHYAAIGNVNFTTEEQHFQADYKIPEEAAGKDAQSIAFNLAEIKEANDYTLKNFKWYLKCDVEGKTPENLINATGDDNFKSKVVGGDIVPAGIETVTTENKKVSNVTYNLAGQRVSKEYKGIVIRNGKKAVVK